MNTQDFCYWLQGYFELVMTSTKEGITPQQVEVIKEHLRLVFKKETVKETAADAVKNFYDDYAEMEFRSNQRFLESFLKQADSAKQVIIDHYEQEQNKHSPFRGTPETTRGQDYSTKSKPIEIVCSGANTHIDLSKVSCTGANSHVDLTNPGVPAPPEPPPTRLVREGIGSLLGSRII